MSATETMVELRAALANICETTTEAIAVDEVASGVVAYPASAKDVVEILRLANEHDAVVIPTGGMTKLKMGGIPERADILLSTKKLSGTLFYDPGDLTAGFGAGTTIAEAQRVLGQHHQFLPLDVMAAERATIGGVLASAAHGPMKAGYGGVRDYCIGIEFVTPDGAVVKGGGRVVKNVAGYDLMKLMIGSFGTLGVITSANFKVFPRPQQTRTFAADFESAEEALRYRDRVVGSAIGNGAMCMELVSPRAHEYLAEQEVRDPDHYHPSVSSGRTPQRRWTVYLRAAGSDAVVARYRRELGSDVAEESSGVEEQELWRRIAEFEPSVAQRHQNAMVVYVNIPIKSVGAALRATEQAAVEHNLIFASIGRMSVGNLAVALMPLAVDPPSAMQYAAAASALRGGLPKDASAVVARCPTEAKRHFDVWGTSPTDASVMKAVRAAVDPRRVLNRGR